LGVLNEKVTSFSCVLTVFAVETAFFVAIPISYSFQFIDVLVLLQKTTAMHCIAFLYKTQAKAAFSISRDNPPNPSPGGLFPAF